ncbi:Hypothetical protein GLP15_2968 [Giardia lamblia P15]|uniref:Uncharacterized protein n=1 Tax=Giardia intestinalis (strain P15) TaxID=658858 RepID=E1EYV6_GIAIA|nr:Hypothetical protein GLP15_2968 [Giardia lamblia P15]
MKISSLLAAIGTTLVLLTGVFLGLKIHIHFTRIPCLSHRAKGLRIVFLTLHITAAVFALAAAAYHIYDVKAYKAITLKSLFNAGWWSFIMMILDALTGIGIMVMPVLIRRCRGRIRPPLYFKVMKVLHAGLALGIAIGIFFFHIMEHEIYIRLS